MLTLDDLRIVQGDFRLTADLRVETGARVALIGPSGAGKSTLLSAIAGFLPPSGGRLVWDGKDITGLPPGERPVAMLFQDNNLFPHLTASQNVGLGLAPRLRLTAEESAEVDRALRHTGLGGLGGRKPGQLSGGQQSRVALARALVQRRPILLLDEPFSALGPALKAEMLDLLDRLLDETGATLLMVTHDPADAMRLCPLTVIVADGRAEPPKPTAALLSDPPPALAAYLGTRG